MANTKRDELITWLRDAHAMEAAAVDNVERLIGSVDEYPALKARFQSHLTVSKRQRDDLERELKRVGADTSGLKEWAMRLGGRGESLLSKWTSDSVLKNCLNAYAFQHFEIGSYRSLMAAAEELGMTEIRALCERCIAEQQEMANFLSENIPNVTRQYLKTCTDSRAA